DKHLAVGQRISFVKPDVGIISVIRIRDRSIRQENVVFEVTRCVLGAPTKNVSIRKNTKALSGHGATRKRCQRIETSVESTIRIEAAIIVGYREIADESKITHIDKGDQGSSIGLTREATGAYVETRFVRRGKSIINGAVRIQTRHTKQRGPGRAGRRIINIGKSAAD